MSLHDRIDDSIIQELDRFVVDIDDFALPVLQGEAMRTNDTELWAMVGKLLIRKDLGSEWND